MKGADILKTACRTCYGSYEWLVMLFGLMGAVATNMTLINQILKDYIDIFCVVYLDDILIYSRTIEEHLDHLKKIFDILLANNLYAKLSKCEFLQIKIIFLGHILTDKGKEVDPKKIQAIHDWPPPRNIHELRAFLGLANFYREYIYHYSHIAILLTHVLKKGVKYIWTPMCQAAFEKLKDALTHAPVLRLPSPELLLEVHTEASTEALGVVLLLA
jgi:hypothetical protein